jgi:hypothetical protein
MELATIPAVSYEALGVAVGTWQYKPGATFSVHPSEGYGYVVTLDLPITSLPDMNLGSLRTSSNWAAWMTLDELPAFLWRLVLQAETHEAGEWLSRLTEGGELEHPYDPHRETT